MNTTQNMRNDSEQQQFVMKNDSQAVNSSFDVSSSPERLSENQRNVQLSQKTTQQLITMILSKDTQIKKLTQTMQELRKQTMQKTTQAQLWCKKVEQAKYNYNCLQKKYQSNKQKYGLFKQINQRLFSENLQLEKNLLNVNKEITDVKEQMKAQQSMYSIKVAEMRKELGDERKMNKEHVKQIVMLKALIKELQEELQQQDEQDEDGDYGDNRYCKGGDASTKVTDFDQTAQDQCNALIQPYPKSHSRGSHSLPNSHELKSNELDQELQQSDIVFSQA